MEVIVFVSNPHVLEHKINNVTCHRAVTRKELDFLCTKIDAKCVLVEYTGEQDISWIADYPYPTIVLTNTTILCDMPILQLSPEQCTKEMIEFLLDTRADRQPPLEENEDIASVEKISVLSEPKIDTAQEESTTIISIDTEEVREKQQQLVEENKELKLNLEQVQQEYSDKQIEWQDKENQLRQSFENEVSTLKLEYNTEKEQLELEYTSKLDLITQEKEELVTENTTLQQLQERLTLENSELTEKNTTLQTTITELENQVTALEESNQKYVLNEMDEDKRTQELTYNFETQMKALESELNLKNIAYTDLKIDFERVSAALESANASLQDAKNNVQDVEMLKNRIAILEDIEKKLNSKLDEVVRDKQKTASTLTTKMELIEQLNQQIDTLQASLNRVRNTSGNTAVTEPKSLIQHYSGNAKIINCFGTGSYGVTSMVFSIADTLRNKKVLVIDMDIVNPSLDSWFQQSPSCPSLDFVDETRKTGVCALFERGASYVSMNLDKIIKPITKNLFYFSGIYVPFVRARIYNTDFDAFINGLGSQFDYIIFDCGRLGSSVETDSIIKTLAQIAHKNVIVALNDVFNIRNASIRLSDMHISKANLLWVLNLSDNSMIAPNITKFTGGAKIIIVPKDMSLYGRKRSLNSLPLLKGKISEIHKSIK